jgi:hypothetical protein
MFIVVIIDLDYCFYDICHGSNTLFHTMSLKIRPCINMSKSEWTNQIFCLHGNRGDLNLFIYI